MAENSNDPKKQGERNGKIYAPSKKEQGAVSVNSESFSEEIMEGLHGVNSSFSWRSFAMGNATAGNNQQLSAENLKEELAPRTSERSNTKSSNIALGNATAGNNQQLSTGSLKEELAPKTSERSDTKASNKIGIINPVSNKVEEVAPPKEGKDDVVGKSEQNIDAEKNLFSEKHNASKSKEDTPTPKGNSATSQAADETDAELRKNAEKQGKVVVKENSDDKEKDTDQAANSGIILKIMGEFSATVDEGKEISKEKDSEGEAATKKALDKVEPKEANAPQDNPNQGGGDLGSNDANQGSSGGESSGPENTTENKQTTESTEKGDKQDDALDAFDVTLDKGEEDQLIENKKLKEAASRVGLDVGRSVGYGAKLENNGKKITPFGPDPASAKEALSKFRDSHTEAAQAKGDIYYSAYANAYNEGMGEGIRLKKEAAGAARNAALKEEQKTTEYKVGMILGTACGAASAKGQSEIDTFYEVPKKGGGSEKVIVKGPMAPVRTAVMSQKQTPDGKLQGDALERAFVQHYNVAQGEASKKKRRGPEKDADYQAGYARGYKLGGQRAAKVEEDPALVAEKIAYHKLPSDAPKPKQQQKNGFYDGYNKGQIDAENSKAAEKKKAIEERNANPIFMSGFSTGNMQGFLKAMLDPSKIDLLTALNNSKVMREGGVPDFFPIPDAIRTNMKAHLTKKGDASVKALLEESYFKEGWTMGFNAGYGRGEQSRMTFKREQFRMHPDYQESLKVVYTQNDKKGEAVERNMGQLKAYLQVDYRELQKKKEPSDKEKTKLGVYNKTLQALDAEVNKQSEYYQRGVVDCYNAALPEEEKRVKGDRLAAIYNDPEYKAGFKWGQKVGNKVFDSKEKIKDLRRNGLDITVHNKKLNKALTKTRTDAQGKGKMYFDGYARGYSDTLRERENKGKESDMGNKIEDLDKLARDVDSDFFHKHKEEAKKAFQEGATQGYNLYFENKRINVETGQRSSTKDFKMLYERHLADKEKAYKADKKLSKHTADLMKIYKAGYSFIKDTMLSKETKGYGAPKGLWDALEFNKGYKDAEEGANEKESSDTYKVGYNAGKKQAQYSNFRNNMIQAQQNLQAAQANNPATTPTNSSDHIQYAATENSIANTSALGALKVTRKKMDVEAGNNVATSGGSLGGENAGNNGATSGSGRLLGGENVGNNGATSGRLLGGEEVGNNKAVSGSRSGKEEQFYILNAAEHMSQAKDNAQNRQWITKVLYLKEGLDLKGTALTDTTISIHILDEAGKPITKTISNQPQDIQVARDFCNKKDYYIEQMAAYYLKALIAKNELLRKEKNVIDKIEGAENKAPLLSEYQKKLATIKRAYVEGYNALFDGIEKESSIQVFKEWNHDVAYIEGIKSQAPDYEEVKKLILPTPPAPGLKVNKDSEDYKAGELEGILMGQRIKSGIVDLKEDTNVLVHAQGNDYESGHKEGKAIGARTGQVAATEMEKKPPTKEDIKKNLTEQKRGKVDPEFERGYVEGFFVDYWKSRDYHYGKNLGYQRARDKIAENGSIKKGNVDGPIEPEVNVTLEDRVAFFEGFNKGRENGRLGKEKDATGKEGEEANSFKAKLKNIVLEVVWRNAALKAAEELNITPRLGLVFDENNHLYHQFAETKSMKALKSDASKYSLPPAYEVENLESVLKLPAVIKIFNADNASGQADWSKASADDQKDYAKLFKEVYDKYYEATYQEALVDMMNLSMVVAMDTKGTAGVGGGGDTTDSSSIVNDIMSKLDALFANRNHQNFSINELKLIDDFYDLERRIESRHGPIKGKLEEVENYRLAMSYDKDAETTLAEAEIQQLEQDIEKLKEKQKTADPSERKKINKEKRDLVRSLKKKRKVRRKLSGNKSKLQRKWEKAEDEVKKEIDAIRVHMEENLKFKTPLESNDDILKYIKVNLETSAQRNKGKKVYQDPNIFNNLELGGKFDYQKNNKFDAFVTGDGRLKINADAEKMTVRNVEVKIEREGFKFVAKGLEHDHAAKTFTLFDGNLVTPKIEGGRHHGVKLDYNFQSFQLQKGNTIKAQIETQIDKLKGG